MSGERLVREPDVEIGKAEQAHRCPACGHRLSMFSDPEPKKAEVLAIRIAERVATWPFALGVIGLVAVWVFVNVVWRPFEPYPVVALAVISAALASLAALQGPLILLTQRRAAERDRLREREVLMVAANSEADLHRLEAKLDQLRDQLRDQLTERGTGRKQPR